MKVVLSNLVLIGFLALMAQPSSAKSTPVQSLPPDRTQQTLTPNDVVFMAYRGFWKAWNIPQAATLVEAHQVGKLSAKDLVKQLVELRQVPASVLKDNGYINAVDATLRSLQRRSS